VAFVDGAQHLSLATRGTAGWSIEVVDGSTVVGRLALAYGANGMAHLAYHVSTGGGTLKYAARNGSDWIFSIVALPGDLYNAPDIAIGSDGLPRISFYDGTANALKVATLATPWSFSTVESGTRTVTHSSIAQGPDGRWHVAYCAGDPSLWIHYAVSN